jgi:hypothetical protein
MNEEIERRPRPKRSQADDQREVDALGRLMASGGLRAPDSGNRGRALSGGLIGIFAPTRADPRGRAAKVRPCPRCGIDNGLARCRVGVKT